MFAQMKLAARVNPCSQGKKYNRYLYVRKGGDVNFNV